MLSLLRLRAGYWQTLANIDFQNGLLQCLSGNGFALIVEEVRKPPGQAFVRRLALGIRHWWIAYCLSESLKRKGWRSRILLWLQCYVLDIPQHSLIMSHN